MATNTTANSVSWPRILAWRAICAASSLCGSPLPEKMGSFWPRMRVFIPSMTEMPVWMKSRGYSREVGLIGLPLTSISASGTGGGPPSMGMPSPLNTRPSILCETPSICGSPRKRMRVSGRVSPEVPSKIWTTTKSLAVSSTIPSRWLPAASTHSTSSR